ncbi:STAS domain-containing protein [Geomonas ferrireducens]|uniref:STAS domain-containing protein n=1 Tax=Geomonas ferrireducens TaxID=2570227 RepID=UPI0010A827CC|nr:STAS domain-containing protein [Geomonas ferrireducens]
MPKKGFVNDVNITLDGDCTMERVADLHALLAERCAALTGTPPSAAGVRVDLAQVTGIDACGCQLLALFLEQLRRLGIAACADGAGAEIRERIELLGFCTLFSGEHQQP